LLPRDNQGETAASRGHPRAGGGNPAIAAPVQLGPENVAELAACGRARWKIENETFNVLKTKGYNLEHSFGHGKQHLAAVLVALNLLAFAIHAVCDIGDEIWRLARQKHGSRSQFFNSFASITSFLIFASWDDLFQTLAFTKPPPLPP
jgi:hypothetical protein